MENELKPDQNQMFNKSMRVRLSQHAMGPDDDVVVPLSQRYRCDQFDVRCAHHSPVLHLHPAGRIR